MENEAGRLFREITIKGEDVRSGDLVPLTPGLFAVVKSVTVKDGDVLIKTPTVPIGTKGLSSDAIMVKTGTAITIHQPIRVLKEG